MEFLFLALFLFTGIGYHFLFKIKIEQGIFLSLSINTIFLFIMGYFYHLETGFYIIVILSILCLIISIIYIFKTKPKVTSIITPGVVALIVAYTIFYFVTRNAYIHEWDESTHWAIAVKFIHGTNELWTSGLQTLGPAMTHYTMTKITGFNEPALYLSQWFINFASLTLILSNTTWKDWKKALLFIFGGYSAIALIGGQLLMYSDTQLGIIAASLMASFLLFKEDGFKRYIWVVPGLAMLSQVKSGTGMMMCMLFVIFALITEILYNKNVVAKFMPIVAIIPAYLFNKLCSSFTISYSGYSTSLVGSRTLKSWLTSTPSLIAYVLIAIGIALIVINLVSKKKRKLLVFLAVIIFLFAPMLIAIPIGDSAIAYRGVENVKYILTQFALGFKLNNLHNLPIYIAMVIVFIITFLQILTRKDRNKIFILYASVWYCAALFVAGLLFLYLLIFSDGEAMNVASFERYVGTACVLCYVMLFATIFIKPNDKEISTKASFSLVVGLAILFTPPIGEIYKQATESYIAVSAYRNYAMVASDGIKSHLDDGDKVFIIIQKDDGTRANWFKYEMAPYKINGGYWTQNEDKHVSQEFILDFMSKHDYKYLFTYIIDDYFVENYSMIFKSDIATYTLYENVGDGLVKVK